VRAGRPEDHVIEADVAFGLVVMLLHSCAIVMRQAVPRESPGGPHPGETEDQRQR
jgi:hypothetical protein